MDKGNTVHKNIHKTKDKHKALRQQMLEIQEKHKIKEGIFISQDKSHNLETNNGMIMTKDKSSNKFEGNNDLEDNTNQEIKEEIKSSIDNKSNEIQQNNEHLEDEIKSDLQLLSFRNSEIRKKEKSFKNDGEELSKKVKELLENRKIKEKKINYAKENLET
ncbi:MAG: hypothetical protein MJ252_09360, partial [archaeon]|nr:hypothetical protein [archaeon]